MMLKRAAASATPASTKIPASSGPRWRSVAIIRPARAVVAGCPSKRRYPAMPHTSVPRRRRLGRIFERVRQVHETIFFVGEAIRGGRRRRHDEARTGRHVVVFRGLVVVEN